SATPALHTETNDTSLHDALPIYLDSVDQALKQIKSKIEWLVFGDLHLQDVRRWREEMFEKRGYKCRFPIWNKSIHELLPVLQLQDRKSTCLNSSHVSTSYAVFCL